MSETFEGERICYIAFDPESSTIEYREEIVRCRDCRYSKDYKSGREKYEGTLWCDYLTDGIGFNVLPTGFCAWGERRGA